VYIGGHFYRLEKRCKQVAVIKAGCYLSSCGKILAGCGKLSSPLLVAFAQKERVNNPVIPKLVEREQSDHLRQYFRERLEVHR